MSENISSLDTILLITLHHIQDIGDDSYGGKNNHDRNNHSEGRLERDTPKFVVVNFGILGLLEKK